MDIVLGGALDAAVVAQWRHALTAAGPEFRWHGFDEARPIAARIRAAVVARPPAGALQGLPALGLIQSLWAGVDSLLADHTLPEGVPIARMVDPAMNAAMAETALWATLALQRHFFAYARQQAERRWQEWPQRRAADWRVTVLGLGEMGLTTARRLVAMGYRVHGWARRPRELGDGVQGAFGADGLRELLPHTDVLINLLPLTDQTRGLLAAPLFAALPRGAGLVNLARGAHLVEADLLDALDRGQIGHAVLDVFATEPLPAAHAFWGHPRITVLPHAAAATDPDSAAAVAVANLRALAAGRPLAHLVDRTRGY